MIDESADARRRAQRQAAKLRGIVAGRLGVEPSAPTGPVAGAEALSLPGGAGLVVAAPAGDGGGPRAHFIVDADDGLGAMLLLADRAGAAAVSIYRDIAPMRLARHAQSFDFEIELLTISGRDVVAVDGAEAQPEPEPPCPDVAIMALSGADVDGVRTVEEHGDAVAEVAGLEIARASMVDGGLVVRVGVGWADQELAALIQPGLASVDRIRAAASLVREHRRPGAPPHPLQRVAPERWLRHRLMADPARWGFASLEPVSLVEPRVGLRLNAPAAARGSRLDGSSVLVVCSVGVNPELVPIAGDLHRVRHPDAELVLAMPAADAYPAIARQAQMLAAPVSTLGTPPVHHRWPDAD